jgi:uncharacterized protein
MKKIAEIITTYPRLILIVALILAVFAVFGARHTPINYDVLSYLPQEAESIQGQNILAKDFKAADTGYILFRNGSSAEILKIKQDLSAIKGVEKVTWLSDLVDPSVPDVFIPPQIISLFKKGDNALLHINFANPAKTPEAQASVARIKTYLKGVSGEPLFTGLPVFVYENKLLVQQQIPRCMAIATVLTLIVTGIATQSLMVPLLFLVSMGLAIIFNQGSNYFLGSISVMTNSFAPIVQLGVTIDFSIFLIHRFREETLHMGTRAAMATAIEKTAVAIIPCALVTMAGFLALAMMRVRIGTDLGVVMAKGVFLGLVATIVILPALTLTFERFIKLKDVHGTKKRITPAVNWLLKRRGVALVLFLILFVPAGYCKYHAKLSYSLQDILPLDLPALRAVPKISQAMGPIEMVNILFPSNTPRWQQKQALDEIAKLPGTLQAISLGSLADPAIPESFIPQQARERFTRGDYTQAMVRVDVLPGSNEGNALIGKIRTAIKKQDISGTFVSGVVATSKDITDLSASDLVKVDMAGLVLVGIILMIMFTSISIPILLIAGIQLAIYLNLTIPYVNGHLIPYITLSCLSSIQLGSCVNYAIFLISRYREERQKFAPKEAMLASLLGTGSAIFTSGLCLFCSTIGMVFISDVNMFKVLSLLIGRGALISVGVILLLLPGIIVIFDKLIRSTSLGWKKSIKKHEEKGECNEETQCVPDACMDFTFCMPGQSADPEPERNNLCHPEQSGTTGKDRVGHLAPHGC